MVSGGVLVEGGDRQCAGVSSISETMALLSSADIGRIVEELEEALDAQRANTRQLQQELESVEDEFSKLQSLFTSLPTSCDDNV